MIGKTIFHYNIIEKLGEGGMGVVYKAEDIKLKRPVALKFLPSHIAASNDDLARFNQEAQAAAILNHPNICTIYNIEEVKESNEDIQFISMEYVDGITLSKKIANSPLKINDAISYAIQIGEALQEAHANGIIHRDIKSENIMINSKNQVKILDFGLAKLKGSLKLTKASNTLGTIAYMSPEQIHGEKIDARSDIFSFGIVLFEMLTGILPFRGKYEASIMYSILNEEPAPLQKYLPDAGSDLIHIINRVLEKDPEDRYQSMKDIVIELRRLKKHSGDIQIKVSPSKELYKNDPIDDEKSLNPQPLSKLSSTVDTITSSKNKKRFIIETSVIGLLIVISLVYLFLFNKTTPGNSPSLEQSLAVMYFEDIPDHEDKDHTGEMLTNLLITSLSQIKGLEVISRERLLDIQNDIGNITIKNLSPSLAEKVANKAGVTTMLLGSILRKKPNLAVTTRLIDVKSGRIISSERITNFPTDQIFSLVDSLAYLTRNNLQINIKNSSETKPIADVTTNSPEAYRAYVEGLDLFFKFYNREAYSAFLKAIELDSNFAMAYFNLSIVQQYLGYIKASLQSVQKAVKLSDNVTELEKNQILARNYQLMDKPEKSAEILEKVIGLYPHEIEAYNSLGYDVYFLQMLQLKKASDVFDRGVKYNPSAKLLWNQLAYCFTYLNQKKEAINAIKKYINLAPAEPNPYDSEGDIYAWFMEYDSSRASYQKAIKFRKDLTAWKIGCNDVLRQKYKDAEQYFKMSEYQLPIIEIHKGLLKKAEQKLTKSSISEISLKDRLSILIHIAYETGRFQKMLQLAKELSTEMKKNPLDKIFGRDYLAWALVKNRKSNQAHRVLLEMQEDVSNLSPVLQIIVDYSSAMISFEEDKKDAALEKFKEVFQLFPPIHAPNIFYAISQLNCGQIQSAIKEFEKITYWTDNFLLSNLPGADYYWPIPAVKAHFWLGVAYEKLGQKEKAAKEYEKFLGIWKDADFNSHEIKDAKERIAKLKSLASK